VLQKIYLLQWLFHFCINHLYFSRLLHCPGHNSYNNPICSPFQILCKDYSTSVPPYVKDIQTTFMMRPFAQDTDYRYLDLASSYVVEALVLSPRNILQ